MEEAKPLSVHLVSANEPLHLPEWLSSLDDQTWYEFQIIAVDNASDDGVARWLQAERKDVIALRNFRNQGLARAHNQAIALALSRWPKELLSERFIAFTRPEMVFDPACFETLLWEFKRDPSLMMASPVVLRAERRLSENGEKGETIRTMTVDNAGVALTKSRRWIPQHRDEQLDQLTVATPFAFSDACLVVRASLFPQLQFEQEWLDTDLPECQIFFDLAWRCHWLGGKSVVIPQARVWLHDHQLQRKTHWLARAARWWSAPRFKDRVQAYALGLLYTKNETWENRFFFSPWVIWFLLRYLVIGISDPRLFINGVSQLKRWPRLRRKRRALFAQRKATSTDIRGFVA